MSKSKKAKRIAEFKLILPGEPEAEVIKPASLPLVNAMDEAAYNASLRAGFKPPPGVIPFNTSVRQELQRDILSKTLREEKRELGLQSFEYFVKKCMFPLTWMEHYSSQLHQQMIDQIEQIGEGEDLWFFIPREHRKSYLITVCHSIWLIIKDPDIRILIVGARKETIKGLVGLIRNAFTKGAPGFQHFQEIYPEFIHDVAPGNNLEFTHKFRTKPLADPTVRGTYLGVAGASWRCDVLKFDDAIERRHVRRPELAVSASQDMLDLLPLLATGSKYRMTTGAGTRWSYFDPYSNIIGEDNEDSDQDVLAAIKDRMQQNKTNVIVRHSFEDPDRLCEHCPKHIVAQFPHGHPSMETGEVIGDPVVTKALLLERYAQYQRDPKLGEALYFHQYLNVCKAPSHQKFSDQWYYVLGTPSWGYVRKRVLSIDSADKDFQKQGSGDYMVALFGEFAEDGRLNVRHGLRSNSWTREQLQDNIIAWCQSTGWWPSVVVKEKVSNDTFLTDMQKKFLDHGHPVVIVIKTRTGDLQKQDFITETLQAPMERGDITWGAACPMEISKRAMYELTNLAQTRYDDVADTLALFFLPGVRVMAAKKGFSLESPPTQPGLDSYFPERVVSSPEATPDVSPFDQAASSQRVVSAILETGPGAVRFDPPLSPGTLGYDVYPGKP